MTIMTRRMFDWHPELNIFASKIPHRAKIMIYKDGEYRLPVPDEVGFIDAHDVAEYIFEDPEHDPMDKINSLCVKSPWKLAWMEYEVPYFTMSDPELQEMVDELMRRIPGGLHVGAYTFVYDIEDGEYRSALSGDIAMRLLASMDESIDPKVSIPVWKMFARRDGRDIIMANRAREYECHTVQILQLFIADRKTWESTGYIILYLDEHGRPIPDTEAAVVNPEDQIIQEISIKPFMMALSLLNCRNVEAKVVPYGGHQQKKLKRYGSPYITRRTLLVRPTGKRYEGSGESTGRKNRWHICRGHFKTFTDEAPLFGRVTGTFWWSPTARGRKSRGEVHKDYQVEPE